MLHIINIASIQSLITVNFEDICKKTSKVGILLFGWGCTPTKMGISHKLGI